MKKLCLITPLLCLLLCGCGKNPALESYYEFSEALRGCDEVSFIAAVRAEYPDRRFDFVLNCEKSSDGCLVTVIEPECIEGISVKLVGTAAELRLGTVIADTGALEGLGLSPVSAMPLIFEALERGFPDACWVEGDYNCWKLITDDDTSLLIRCDAQNKTPVSAEIISQGRVVIFCTFQCFNTRGNQNERSTEENLG